MRNGDFREDGKEFVIENVATPWWTALIKATTSVSTAFISTEI